MRIPPKAYPEASAVQTPLDQKRAFTTESAIPRSTKNATRARLAGEGGTCEGGTGGELSERVGTAGTKELTVILQVGSHYWEVNCLVNGDLLSSGLPGDKSRLSDGLDQGEQR